MRCPKCGYISFDYNATCPKCNKDISEEQRKTNLPSYIPNPPRLLDTLVGIPEDSPDDFDIQRDMNERGTLEHDLGVELDDSGIIEMPDAISTGQEEQSFDEDVGLESFGDGVESGQNVIFDETPLSDTAEIDQEEDLSDSLSKLDMGDMEDEISLEPVDDSTVDVEPTPPPIPKQDEDVALDLDDISIEETEKTNAVTGSTGEIEALELDLDELDISEVEGQSQGISPLDDEAEMITVEIDRKKMKESGKKKKPE